MRSQWPPSASSTALSMISQRQCMRPRESVDPMYMPGRLRTASRPSRTGRWRAVYSDADLVVAAFFAAVVGTSGRVVAGCDGPRQAHRSPRAARRRSAERSTTRRHKVTIRT